MLIFIIQSEVNHALGVWSKAGFEVSLEAARSSLAENFSMASAISAIFALLLKFGLRKQWLYTVTDHPKNIFVRIHEFQLSIPANEAFEHCMSFLSTAKGAKVVSTDRENGVIRVHFNFDPWALIVRSLLGVKIDQPAANFSRVRVYSKPMNPKEFGKNRENVSELDLAKAIEDAARAQSELKRP